MRQKTNDIGQEVAMQYVFRLHLLSSDVKMNQDMNKIIVVSAIILFLCVVILYINIKKRTAAELRMKEVQQKLEENYKELETAYEVVTSTQKKLYQKYEELKVSENRNRKLAYNDSLTGLPNRNAFTEYLHTVMLHLKKKEQYAIVYIDVDDFKEINDTLGHSYGDELLIDITYRIKQALDGEDFFARFVSDEFIILFKLKTSMEEIEQKVRKIQTVFSYPFVLASKELFVTVSIGLCVAPRDGVTVQQLLKNVDAAMNSAKEQGKNRYCYYDTNLNKKLMKRIEMQSEIRNAIEADQFKLYYQAQVDLENDRISGFEALIRWEHPQKGMIYPMDFIELAEDTGLIIPLGRWILFEACHQLKEWQQQGITDINMAVNFSARQFLDTGMVEMIQTAILETGIRPENLEIEITETVALENVEYSIEIIHQLKDMGIQVSLDDFGTGYSSMNYLKLLPVSKLKIDKSFLDTVMENESDQKIVKMIIELAQTLNLVVIAEGVEFQEQALFLKGIKCNKAQGYLYSRPVLSKDAKTLLCSDLTDSLG